MKINYSILVGLYELYFNGPKKSFTDDNFYYSEEYKHLEEQISEQIKTDLVSLFGEKAPNYVYVQCEEDYIEEGSYNYSAEFELKGELKLIPKDFKVSKKNIANLETLMKKEAMLEIKKIEKIYPTMCIDEIEIADWEIID